MNHPERFLLAGVMGWPVMHSRSPMLHNYWFARHGLAGTYVPLAIAPDRLEQALRALAPLGFAGCNLTIPHKENGATIVDEVDASGKAVGAINCVTVREDGTLFGSNNDGFGFIESVRQEHPGWRADAGPVVVIGAGGAARAVVYALAQAGAPEIRLCNRTLDRADAMERQLGGPVRSVSWDDRERVLDGAAMVVNTTSQGMVGQPPLEISLDRLPTSALVCDIIYLPRETPLLVEAHQRGNRTLNGLGMLLHQARPAWKSWFGIETQVTPELRALIEATL